jgi:hypothetical protein
MFEYRTHSSMRGLDISQFFHCYQNFLVFKGRKVYREHEVHDYYHTSPIGHHRGYVNLDFPEPAEDSETPDAKLRSYR